MKISVDKDSCEGHGKCVEVAPSLFRLPDDSDLVQLLKTEPETEAERLRAMAAAAACPRSAIKISKA